MCGLIKNMKKKTVQFVLNENLSVQTNVIMFTDQLIVSIKTYSMKKRVILENIFC